MRPLSLEQLEDRSVPASFTAGSVPDLVADINAANLSGGLNTITLVAGKTFTATASANGHDAFPFIATGDDLTIVGNGDTIERSTGKGTLAFRLFDVAAGASLTLANLTLQNGLSVVGGAITNNGSLILNGVMVQNNIARDDGVSFGGFAAGGGIFSTGSLVLQDCTLRNNQALGTTYRDFGLAGTNGLGGGVYVSGGTASLTNVSIYSNTARGGDGSGGGWVTYSDYPYYTYLAPGGDGGKGLGGGMYVAAGTVNLHGTKLNKNSALGGKGGTSTKGLPDGHDGQGLGGGLFINDLASVYLDAFTLAHVINNKATTDFADVYGSYTIVP